VTSQSLGPVLFRTQGFDPMKLLAPVGQFNITPASIIHSSIKRRPCGSSWRSRKKPGTSITAVPRLARRTYPVRSLRAAGINMVGVPGDPARRCAILNGDAHC
jgi:hypothetical protein